MVRLTAPLLNMNFNATDTEIEQVSPSHILTENNLRVREDLECATVIHLKLRVAVGAGANQLAFANGIANVQSPGRGILQYRDLTSEGDNLSGGVLGRIDLRQLWCGHWKGLSRAYTGSHSHYGGQKPPSRASMLPAQHSLYLLSTHRPFLKNTNPRTTTIRTQS